MKIFGVDGRYSVVIVLLFTLIFNTINVAGITEPEPIPMTMEQIINNLLEGGWEVSGGTYSGPETLITTHPDGDFYTSGYHVTLDLKRDDEIITVYPVGLSIHADVFKDDIWVTYGYGNITAKGTYKLKMHAPSEVGYYKINVYSDDIPSFGKLISCSGTVYVKATSTPAPTPSPKDSDGDGWTDDQEKRAGTYPYKKDTDNDGYWDPQDPNPLDPTIPISIPTVTPTPPTPTPASPGFEAMFVIIGLLAVAYLVKRR